MVNECTVPEEITPRQWPQRVELFNSNKGTSNHSRTIMKKKRSMGTIKVVDEVKIHQKNKKCSARMTVKNHSSNRLESISRSKGD